MSNRTSGRRGRSAINRGVLRVLVLGHTAELGGAELALERLCEEIRRSRSDVDVRVLLLDDGPLVERLEQVGVPVQVLAAPRGVVSASRKSLGAERVLRLAFGLVATEFRLWGVMQRFRPDVVHTNSLKAHLLGTIPAVAARRVVVWYAHDRIAEDYMPRRAVRIVRAVGRLPRAVIANSRATAATLGRRATVAYPGLRAAQTIPPECPVPARAEGPVVGIVGRISETKGQLEFVRAAERIVASRPEVRFRVVGGTAFGTEAYQEAVVAESRRLGLEDRFEWVGSVPDTRAELDAMSVCVHASPVPEPFGQVVAEALARGVPVVATDAGGVPEILRGSVGAAGTLVPPGDVEAMAEAVLDVLDDLSEVLRRADEARAEVVARFGIDTTASVVTEVWRAAVTSQDR